MVLGSRRGVSNRITGRALRAAPEIVVRASILKTSLWCGGRLATASTGLVRPLSRHSRPKRGMTMTVGLALLAIVFAAATADGQGSMSGCVNDKSGGALPGVEVVASNAAGRQRAVNARCSRRRHPRCEMFKAGGRLSTTRTLHFEQEIGASERQPYAVGQQMVVFLPETPSGLKRVAGPYYVFCLNGNTVTNFGSPVRTEGTTTGTLLSELRALVRRRSPLRRRRRNQDWAKELGRSTAARPPSGSTDSRHAIATPMRYAGAGRPRPDGVPRATGDGLAQHHPVDIQERNTSPSGAGAVPRQNAGTTRCTMMSISVLHCAFAAAVPIPCQRLVAATTRRVRGTTKMNWPP